MHYQTGNESGHWLVRTKNSRHPKNHHWQIIPFLVKQTKVLSGNFRNGVRRRWRKRLVLLIRQTIFSIDLFRTEKNESLQRNILGCFQKIQCSMEVYIDAVFGDFKATIEHHKRPKMQNYVR